MATWGDLAQVPAHGAATEIGRNPVLGYALITIGSAGAVASVAGSPGLTASLKANSEGTYTVTFPACQRVAIVPGLLSVAQTVDGIHLTAVSATAGTAEVVTTALAEDNGDYAREATDPASGDVITLLFFAEP
ncbi:MAG TPA: hypothetical protein VKY73_21090 [Polyangiaceae bacterium]|nr:hypothetical protein [Polyangiaceae bacterium]